MSRVSWRVVSCRVALCCVCWTVEMAKGMTGGLGGGEELGPRGEKIGWRMEVGERLGERLEVEEEGV